MARAALWTLALLASLLSGCSDLIDNDERRICRSLLPALEREADRFDIVRIDDLKPPAGAAQMVRVVYRPVPSNAATGSERAIARSLTCAFAPKTGGVRQLVSVVGPTGALGPVRLFMLQRYWIDSGVATGADPTPVHVLAGAPNLSAGSAFALQALLASLPSIAIYALLATSYALVYGLVGRINLAFGDLASLAGYGAFLGFSLFGDGSPVAALAAAAVLGLFTAAVQGGALGELVIARLAAGPGQHILIATIGISIFWQETMRLTQGAGTRWLSPLMSRPIGIARAPNFLVTLTPMSLVVASVSIVAAIGLVVAMKRLQFGLRWRASADDPIAAAMLGIDQRAMLVGTMVLAGSFAGLGGMLATLFYGGIGYSGGLIIGLKSLIAAIIGGIGSIPGALVGAMIVGVVEAVWSSLFPIEMRDPALFAGLVIILLLKPAGLANLPPPGSPRS